MHGRTLLVIGALSVLFASPLFGQVTIDGRVADEAAKPVPGAQLVLAWPDGSLAAETASAEDGRFTFTNVQTGDYRLVSTKPGFFVLEQEIAVSRATFLEVFLSLKSSPEESVDVLARPSLVEVQSSRPGVRDTITNEQIQLLPAGNSRNFLKALPLAPSVVEDREGKLHLRGASYQNIQYQVDGINVTNPVNGTLQNMVPSDAVENVEVVASGYAPEYGRSSGGIIRVETRTIPNKWQFSLTDAIPNYAFRQRAISEFTPRLTLRGPIDGSRAGVTYAVSGEYRQLFDEDLPRGANAQRRVSLDQVIRGRYAFSDLHLVSATILMNRREFRNIGLNRQSPIESTTDLSADTYAFGFTDRLFFNATTLLESAFQMSAADEDSRAKGTAMYQIWPSKRSGNFNVDEGGNNYRRQWNENFSWSMTEGPGVHQLKAGVEMLWKYYQPRIQLRPFEFYRSDGTLLRRSRYEGGKFEPYFNREMGFFAQDTITLRSNITATFGFRSDWDGATRERTTAPRIGATWYPGQLRRTRISGGIGYFYDRLPLSSLIQDQFPRRIESAFTEDGSGVAAIHLIQRIPAGQLRTPLSKNWEVGIEREIVPQWVVRAGFIRRSGRRELRQIDTAPPLMRDKEVWLEVTNTGASEYRAFDLSMDRSWGQAARLSLAYTVSRSEQTLRVDPFALKLQEEGFEAAPTEWDTPHRLVGWGILPFFKKSRLGITAEARSGFPFSVYDESQQIIGHRNSYRFPTYFTVGLSLEREFPFTKKYRIAVRLSAFNLTRHYNPNFVDSNLNSPDFLKFGNATRPGGNIRLRLVKR